MTSKQANKILGNTKKITFTVYTRSAINPFYIEGKLSEAMNTDVAVVRFEQQELDISDMPESIKDAMIDKAIMVKKDKKDIREREAAKIT